MSMTTIFARLDIPDTRLSSVSTPMPGTTLFDDIPRGFVLPVVVATTKGEFIFCPDNQHTVLETAGF